MLVEPRFSPMVPAGQATQDSWLIAPSVLLQKPRGQGEQLSMEEPPDSVLNRPAVQFLQRSSWAPITSLQVPGKHCRQDSNKVAPSSELQVPAGQRLQEPMSPKPVALLQVPNGQSMHACKAVAPTWLLQVLLGSPDKSKLPPHLSGHSRFLQCILCSFHHCSRCPRNKASRVPLAQAALAQHHTGLWAMLLRGAATSQAQFPRPPQSPGRLPNPHWKRGIEGEEAKDTTCRTLLKGKRNKARSRSIPSLSQKPNCQV